MGAIVTLRGLVATAIEAERVAGGSSFPYTGFTVEESHLPYDKLTSLAAGKCSVLGLASEYTRPETRCSNALKRITPITVAFRRPCNYSDVAALDILVNLIEALEVACIANVTPPTGYQFLRLEPLKDDNNTPFVYTTLREAAMFEAYFTLYYQVVLSF